MLTELYIEALLVDEELADLVWEAWDSGKANDKATCIGWMLIVTQIMRSKSTLRSLELVAT